MIMLVAGISGFVFKMPSKISAKIREKTRPFSVPWSLFRRRTLLIVSSISVYIVASTTLPVSTIYDTPSIIATHIVFVVGPGWTSYKDI
jgi:hypothetical protein